MKEQKINFTLSPDLSAFKEVREKRNGARLEAAETAKEQGLSEGLIGQAAVQAKQICITFREIQSARNIFLSRVGGENPSIYLGDNSSRRNLGYIQSQQEPRD